MWSQTQNLALDLPFMWCKTLIFGGMAGSPPIPTTQAKSYGFWWSRNKIQLPLERGRKSSGHQNIGKNSLHLGENLEAKCVILGKAQEDSCVYDIELWNIGFLPMG